jgi:glycosyltransferase involved in cell wall biosynthesis
MDPGPVGRPPADLAVDVVIPNYNYGAYLADAIESARAQTHPNVRTIVVDDGSTDDSRDVLGAYEGAVETVLKENGGQASALNAGFERCAGDVVMLLDSDDVLKPDAASTVAAAFAASPEAVKVQFRMDVIDGEGRPTGATKPAAHLPMPNGDMRRAELSFPFDLTWMATSGNAFRRAALGPILPLPEADYRVCADWYLVHMAALLGPVVSLDDVGSSYRMHGRNNYEPQAPRLDLAHVRENIRLAAATSPRIAGLADELGLDRPEPILSLADLANRMISLRLDPGGHPVAEDRRLGLLAAAVRAARRRYDTGWPMKAMFLAWFAAMAAAPRRPARRLAELFLFPERRRALNRVLRGLHRSRPLSG